MYGRRWNRGRAKKLGGLDFVFLVYYVGLPPPPFSSYSRGTRSYYCRMMRRKEKGNIKKERRQEREKEKRCTGGAAACCCCYDSRCEGGWVNEGNRKGWGGTVHYYSVSVPCRPTARSALSMASCCVCVCVRFVLL